MNDRKKAAAALRDLAERLESAPRNCLTWCDLKAANKHLQARAAKVLRLAIERSLVPDIPYDVAPIVGTHGGKVHWKGLRQHLAIDTQWLPKYDDEGPAETKATWTLRPDGEIERTVRDADLTADQRREWLYGQSLAWADTLRQVAMRIEAEDTAPTSDTSPGADETLPLEPDDWPVLRAAIELGADRNFVISYQVMRKVDPGAAEMPPSQRKRLKNAGLIITARGRGLMLTSKGAEAAKS